MTPAQALLDALLATAVFVVFSLVAAALPLAITFILARRRRDPRTPLLWFGLGVAAIWLSVPTASLARIDYDTAAAAGIFLSLLILIGGIAWGWHAYRGPWWTKAGAATSAVVAWLAAALAVSLLNHASHM